MKIPSEPNDVNGYDQHDPKRTGAASEEPPPDGWSTAPAPPAASPGEPSQPASRKFDPSRLRMQTDFMAQAGVKKHVVSVPIRRPNKYEWVQFHPDAGWRIQTGAIVVKEEREAMFIIDRELWPQLVTDLVPILLVTTISTQGVTFLTPVRMPGPDGRHNEWHRSLLEGVTLGTQGKWVRIAANQNLGAYEIFEAPGNLGPPAWPEVAFDKLLEIAVRDNFIDTPDHPILKRIRGEA